MREKGGDSDRERDKVRDGGGAAGADNPLPKIY